MRAADAEKIENQWRVQNAKPENGQNCWKAICAAAL
jgi:hypothetical protein